MNGEADDRAAREDGGDAGICGTSSMTLQPR